MSVNLLQIIGADTKLTKVAETRGGEFAGACPFCGGDDRFRCHPYWKGGEWWCRGCSPDNRWHSTADYLIKRDGITFHEAQVQLGLAKPSSGLNGTVKDDPQTYPDRHGASWADFAKWKAELKPYVDMIDGKSYESIFFPDQAGGKFRLFGHKAKFKPSSNGQKPCWYGLAEAVVLASTTNQGALVFVNGQPSVIACHAHGVPAFTIPGGEGNLVTYMERDGLIASLRTLWQGDIIVLLDGDAKGYKAAPAVVDFLKRNGYPSTVAKDPGKGNDAADVCVLNNSSTPRAIHQLPDLNATPLGAPPPPTMPGVTGSTAAQPFNDANLSDAGNAECLVRLYGDELRYCGAMPNGWLRWSGQHWRNDTLGQADQFALMTARARAQAAVYEQDPDKRKKIRAYALASENVGRIKAMLVSASTMPALATDIDQYDADPWRAATPKGTLNLKTGQIVQPDRADYMTMQLGVTPDTNASCPHWQQFISQVFAGDVDLIRYVQRAVGYSLTGDTREQCLFLCYGEGSNGKSVLLNVLTSLLGDYAGNAGFETFEASQRSGVGEYLAMLRGKRFVTIIETEEDRRLAEAKVKVVSDGSPITCRFLHANPFTFRPICKIWFAMNHKPVIRGTDFGIWRRMKLIPFNVRFDGAAKDDTLEYKLMQELPGILNWALAGLADWEQHGLGTCAAVADATKEYKQESDIIGQWFDEEVEADSQGFLPTLDACRSLGDWCKANGHRFPPSSTSFGRWMRANGHVSTTKKVSDGIGKPKNRTVYPGLKLIG